LLLGIVSTKSKPSVRVGISSSEQAALILLRLLSWLTKSVV